MDAILSIIGRLQGLDLDTPQQQLEYALSLHQSGRFQEAEAAYRALLDRLPGNPQVLQLLGVLLHQSGNSKDALDLISSAISAAPDQAQFYSNLCNILTDCGELTRATANGCLAILLQPNFSDAYNNLALSLSRSNASDKSIPLLEKAIMLNGNNASAHNNLGCALQDLERTDEAVPHHEQAVKLDPAFADAFHNLANAYGRQTRTDEARAAQGRVIELRPNSASYLKHALLLQSIPMNKQEIEEDRARLLEVLRKPPVSSRDMVDPSLEVGSTGFGLSYHGMDNKNLQMGLARYYQTHCPGLTVSSKQAVEPKQKGEKIRIGIVSAYLGGHTIGKLNKGLIQHLDREKFDVTLITRSGKVDQAFEQLSKCAQKTILLPNSVKDCQAILANAGLDILFYLDIGMDPLTYFLPFGRLAPVQCTTWGHPETTGIPNMDYFISAKNLEMADSDRRYTEQLVLLDRLPSYYFRPEIAATPLPRCHYGLPDDAKLFCCPQTLFKIHPEFDALLGEILRRQPNSKLLLIDSGYAPMTRRLKDRFARTFPEQVDNVVFLPKLSRREYIDLARIVDVVLDSPHFGGGNSSYEILSSGTPILACPGEYMRTRVTFGQYAQMGQFGCVAQGTEDYVELALKLASDREFYSHQSELIANSNDALYEDLAAVREMETFFETAFAKALS